MLDATMRLTAMRSAGTPQAITVKTTVAPHQGSEDRAGRMLAFGAAGALGGASIITAPWAFNEFVLHMSEWGNTAEVRPGPSAKAWLAVGGLAIAGAALGAYLGGRPHD
ncbi:MAG: hypothetical protein JWL76_70 [Thermoleophilia bacterium]|nr:hypothetical protein [Thermoleophilia bacterium]